MTKRILWALMLLAAGCGGEEAAKKASESEPNNSTATANTIEDGKFSGKCDASDPDYFEVTASAGAINVHLSGEPCSLGVYFNGDFGFESLGGEGSQTDGCDVNSTVDSLEVIYVIACDPDLISIDAPESYSGTITYTP